MRRGPKPRRTARRVAALCFVVSASGAAQDKDAAKLFFEAGAAAAQRQDYAECAKAFAEAHRRNPHSAAIYAAAQCWESDGSLLQAARAYEEALDLGQLDLKQKEQATSRLAALLPKLSFLKLTGPPGTVVSVGAVKDAPTPAEIIVQPGLVSIFARGPGGKRQSLQVQAKAGQVQKLSVAFGEVLAPTNLTPAPQPPAQGVGKTLGWIGVSVGAAAAITAGGFYLAAVSSRNEFEDSGRRDASAREAALSRLGISRVLGVGAAIVGGAGISLVLTAEPGSSAARLRLAPGLRSRH